MPETVTVPKRFRFLFGGCAGMLATCVVQPLDLIKNRMQLSGEGSKVRRTSFETLTAVVRNEGFGGLYSGLTAGLLRQATYASVRLGLFWTLMERYNTEFGQPPNFMTKIAIGMTSGAVAALVGTPADLTLVRMTADGRLPAHERRDYKNAVDALVRISREEGVRALWRGCVPTMGRAMVVNAAQLGSYSQLKQILLTTKYFTDDVLCHITCSFIASLINAVASMPFDMAKTRIQNMKTIDGRPEYRGVVDVIVRVVRQEGAFALWKGLTPYFARSGPHTVLTFIILEQFNKMYKNYVQ